MKSLSVISFFMMARIWQKIQKRDKYIEKMHNKYKKNRSVSKKDVYNSSKNSKKQKEKL